MDPAEVENLKKEMAELKETLRGIVRDKEKAEEDEDANKYLREVEQYGSQVMEEDDNNEGN